MACLALLSACGNSASPSPASPGPTRSVAPAGPVVVTLVAYRGAVAPPGDGPRAMKADPTRSIERYLLETSRSHLTPAQDAVAKLAIAAP